MISNVSSEQNKHGGGLLSSRTMVSAMFYTDKQNRRKQNGGETWLRSWNQHGFYVSSVQAGDELDIHLNEAGATRCWRRQLVCIASFQTTGFQSVNINIFFYTITSYQN